MHRRRRPIGKRTIAALIVEQEGKCPLCDEDLPDPGEDCPPEDLPTIDHIIPRSKGGPDNLWNLQVTHDRCNHEKADSVPTADEVLETIAGRR